MEITYDMEYSLLLDAARTYERLGCPLLSLHILTQYKVSPPVVPERQSSIMVGGSALKLMDDASDTLATGALDLDRWGNIGGGAKTTKPARAADLFGDDEDGETDIFASKGSSKISRAADLFADEPAQLDRAQDIFANDDIFASNPVSHSSAANDIFADYLPNTSPSSVDIDSTTAATEAKEELTSVNVLEDQNLDIYKGSLVIQMLQASHSSNTTIFLTP